MAMSHILADSATKLINLSFKYEKQLDAKDYELLQKEALKLSTLRKYTAHVPGNFDKICDEEYEEWLNPIIPIHKTS